MGSYIQDWNQTDIPASRWVGRCHPLEPQVSRNVHEYFLAHWPWRSERVREKFPQQGLATWHCYNYPDSLDDRIEPGGMLCTILFLIDDELEHLSLQDGTKLIDRIIGVVKKDFPPNPDVPEEWMMHDIWERMRAIDSNLAREIEEPAFLFWRSQVTAERLQPKTLKSYFAYRELDIASGLLLALQRWSMAQHVSPAELDLAQALEKNYSDCITSINDVCSYDKEVLAAKTLHPEGGSLCSAVQVIADETALPPQMAKTILWTMIREWEKNHERIVEELLAQGGFSRDFIPYLHGMEAQLSGTESWSRTTLRYLV